MDFGTVVSIAYHSGRWSARAPGYSSACYSRHEVDEEIDVRRAAGTFARDVMRFKTPNVIEVFRLGGRFIALITPG